MSQTVDDAFANKCSDGSRVLLGYKTIETISAPAGEGNNLIFDSRREAVIYTLRASV